MVNHKYFILIAILFFLIGCGIENSVYFQEPRIVTAYVKGTNNQIPSNGTENAAIKFYGYNQEKDNEKYIFVGYDIYYSFASSSSKRKANVQYPVVPLNTKLRAFPDNTTDATRFPPANFPSLMSNFYEIVSFPVTINMITNNLTQGSNDNVRFTFEKNSELADTKYPMDNGGISGEAGNYVYLGSIFPTYSEYRGKIWGDADPDFRGFYDIDYYNNIGINPESGISTTTPATDCVYKVYFYIVAKGFNSDYERNQNFVESIQSSVVEVRFLARADSKNH